MLQKLNKSLRRAVIMLKNAGNSKFHARVQDFKQLKEAENNTIKAVILGENGTHGFETNAASVQKLVADCSKKDTWPKEVQFKDGILFVVESVAGGADEVESAIEDVLETEQPIEVEQPTETEQPTDIIEAEQPTETTDVEQPTTKKRKKKD